MITLEFAAQDPTAIETYELDFTTELAETGLVIITAAVFSVQAIPGDTTPLVITAQSFVTPLAKVQVTGGALGNTYSVRCTRTWNDGEQDVVSFLLPIEYT